MFEGPVIDSHVHLWDPWRFRMPWLDEIDSLRRQFGPSEFAEHTSGIPVEGVVYVQVDATAAYGLLEAEWAMEQSPPVQGVVAWAPMEDGRVAASYLDALARMGTRIKGVRRLLQSEPDPEFLVAPGLLEGLRMLPEYDFSFDICIYHAQLARAIDMVRACPETQFVLDHLGKPGVRAGLLEPWRAQLTELAAFSNVVCKISGVVTEADHSAWSVDDVKPYVEHALEVFGEDRVLFGGDWPVVTQAASYQRWAETVDQLTRGLSASAKRKMWAENARRVYRL